MKIAVKEPAFYSKKLENLEPAVIYGNDPIDLITGSY
jgi:hypothetical protein